MSLLITQSDYFWADLQRQVDWYRDKAGSDVATRYVDAVESTLQDLSQSPSIGRLRFRDWPGLAGIRSWRVERPYARHLVFYRHFSPSGLSMALAICPAGFFNRPTKNKIESDRKN